MEIIKANETHADVVGYIYSTAWKQAYSNTFPLEYLNNDTAEKRRLEFLKSYRNPSVHYYIAYEDKIAIGIIKLEVRNVNECELSAVYILESYRNNGYGTEIIRFIKLNFKDRKIIIWVLDENVKAKLFYEKNKFCLTTRSRKIWRGNYYKQIEYEG